MYKTIKDTSSAEVVEKKSKFIANMYYVENVKQAEENGVDWFVIEQEAFTQPTLKSVEIGLINLKRIIAEG